MAAGLTFSPAAKIYPGNRVFDLIVQSHEP
jgi:hypothetical protein